MAAYDTYTNADTYFGKRLHVLSWTDASNTNKTKALEEASSRIDRLQFSGLLVDEDQEREFPRYYGDDPDGTETVPDDIKIACYEIAFALLDDIDPDADFTIVSRKFDRVSTTYNRDYLAEHLAAGIPSVLAWRFLQPYLSRAKTIKLNRVT